MHTIAFKEIDTFLVDVNEAIALEHLNEFIFFKLNENGVYTDVTSVVFTRYLSQCKKYFIAHFQPTYDCYFLEPQILQAYFSLNHDANQTTILFILNDYFALYFKKELLYFKEIKQKVSSSEIINFLEKTLCLSIHKCIELSFEEEKLLQEAFKNNFIDLNKLPLIKNNQLYEVKKFFGAVLAVLLVLITVFIYEYNMTSSVKMESKQRVIYPKKELISYKLALLIEQINKESLILVSMDLNNDWMAISLQHKDKIKLIEFLTLYKGEVKRLQFNEKESLYELTTSFKFL